MATPKTGNGIPSLNTEVWRLVYGQALGGGQGTAAYLSHIQRFADLADYLQRNGDSAYQVSPGPDDNGYQAVATDGTATLHLGISLEPLSRQDDPPVRGTATVRLSLPNPYQIIKYAEFGIVLGELPPQIVLTEQVWRALMQPLLSRLTAFIREAVSRWLSIEPDDPAALGETLDDATAEAAEAVAEEAAEVEVEGEVIAELAFVDLSAAFPPLAGLALLAAVPLLLALLAKNFLLHLEITNMTELDIDVTVPYQDEGALTVRPKDSLVPQMGYATDAWGDRTTVRVAYQATFSAMNKSGFSGIGFVLGISPRDVEGQDVCAVISIPWLTDNGIWLGDPGDSPDWEQIYNDHSSSSGELHTQFGNRKFLVDLAIDALSGNNDEYHCVLGIRPI
ncbi:hypothetical protein [Streptomyces buecherae]|uniref:Uncharacterized protein n=1 Tax=Streptomyces buecherae TaxID=2763006 RepID=A0A7H8N1A6_9ACTN|nr:hypothetical protein [Streptomyces buecherae]QKW48265.1 hypothetical protein HUT08_00455 [Streptomyces buecherae]